MDLETIKIRVGNYLRPVQAFRENGQIFLQFPFNRALMEQIKMMEGAKWHGFDEVNPRKLWSIADSPRNKFQLEFMSGGNPYAWYDRPLCDCGTSRPLRKHQLLMKQYGLTFRQVILAAEMRTGKTLAAFEIIEDSGYDSCLWVGPKSALYSTELEIRKWKPRIKPRLVTYEGLEKILQYDWPTPRILVVDESSRVKNPTAKRSQRVKHIADQMREEFGRDCFVILMSGSPAPKSPADWWMQVEIACPGFFREGNINKFKQRLALIESKEGEAGGLYPHLITWKDDTRKCDICGKFEEEHDFENQWETEGVHKFVPMVNEVSKLYERMKGICVVVFKKDCLDIPPLQFQTIKCEPTQETLRAAKLISASAPSTITALTLLRELSDGFQYVEETIGEDVCPKCKGERTEKGFRDAESDLPIDENMIAAGHRLEYDGMMNVVKTWEQPLQVEIVDIACSYCSGTGKILHKTRAAKQIPCPKDQAVLDLLDEHDDVGRIAIYAGFTGSIDRLVKLVREQHWEVIKADGRGWTATIPGKPPDFLYAFAMEKERFPRLAFIGHPGAAGMGIDLSATPGAVFYSNDFNGESRIQAINRIHSEGMDRNRGATIYDLEHLPTDRLVIDNLEKKKKLQDLSLGQLQDALNAAKVAS